MWQYQDLNLRPFILCLLLQLAAEFCSWETPLSLVILTQIWLYWAFTTNQVVSATSAPCRTSPCILPPDNQLEDPEGAFDEDEGLLAGAIQWRAIDIHQLITSPHLLGQGCLAPIFNLCCKEQKIESRWWSNSFPKIRLPGSPQLLSHK